VLDVDQLGHLAGREAVFVFEAGDLLVGGDPPVLLPVDADETRRSARGRPGTPRVAGAAWRRVRTSRVPGAVAR
jgi:hypothetical protein